MHRNDRIVKISGAEYDVFSPWRKILCFTSRAGVCKSVKRQYNKRRRQKVKQEIRDVVS